jgi:septal ring factor EnvC (AmiA/AmiB activator)
VRGVFFASRPFSSDRVPGITDATTAVRALSSPAAPRPADRLEMSATAFLLFALLAARRPVTRTPSAPRISPGCGRDRVRSKSRWRESRKRQATLSEELGRLELQLQIASSEKELLGRLREDYSQRLAAIAVERSAAERAALGSRRALLARARLLHRFGRFGYLRILLEAEDVPAFVQSVALLDSLARRDARLLTAHHASETRLEAGLAREHALKVETDRPLRAHPPGGKSDRFAQGGAREPPGEAEVVFRDPAARRVAVLSDKATRLEGLLARLSQRPEEPVGPSGGIRPWKGVLDWPARGTLTETFGRHRHPKFDAWTQSNGISISLPAGTSVRAIYAGKAGVRAVAGGVREPRHPGSRRRRLHALCVAAGGVGPRGHLRPAGTPVGLAGTGPGGTSPASTSRCGIDRRRVIPWRG